MLSPPDVTAASVRQFGARGLNQTYDRFLVDDEWGHLTAQVIVVAQDQLSLAVHAHDDALAVDFRTQQVINPALADTYRDRPGFFLHERLAELTEEKTPAIVFNGNNIGYWGNQFVIQNGRLTYKRRGPIFDDGRLHAHVTGEHTFFMGAEHRFRIESLALAATRGEAGHTVANVWAEDSYLPRHGLSGFPILRAGRPVWQEHAEYAWDPGLLFNLGRIGPECLAVELRKRVRQLVQDEAELARQAMTIIGIDRLGHVVLLVVEQSERSRGLTVDEAADLLGTRFAVRDAIVLGAAGDAQLATTEEGVLIEPFIAAHAQQVARQVPNHLLSERIRGRAIWARPVPSYVEFRLSLDAPRAPRPPVGSCRRRR